MLNALLQNELSEVQENQEFNVETLDQVNWVFRKLRALNEQQKEINNLAEEEILRINSWRNKELESVNNSIAYFQGLLTEFYKRTRTKVSTPYGKVSSRKSKKWSYVNESELLQYLKDNYKELVRVTEEVNKTDLKKIFKDGVNRDTGEILPGVTVTEEESISIKVGE